MTMFRRQKTLGEIGKFLKSNGFNVNGSSGLIQIADALADHLGKPRPFSKDARWEFLAAFVGKPDKYEVWKENRRARKAVTFAAKVVKGAKESFHDSREWMALRYEVLKERGARCECCGATRADGVIIQVDHVKPRSLFPELALKKSNLQVLCRPCNLGKSNKDSTDWREGASLQ